MATIDMGRHEQTQGRRRAEGREFRFTLWLVYVLFLAVAIVSRLLPRRWRAGLPGMDGSRNVFAEARIAASTCIPFAYR